MLHSKYGASPNEKDEYVERKIMFLNLHPNRDVHILTYAHKSLGSLLSSKYHHLPKKENIFHLNSKQLVRLAVRAISKKCPVAHRVSAFADVG